MREEMLEKNAPEMDAAESKLLEGQAALLIRAQQRAEEKAAAKVWASGASGRVRVNCRTFALCLSGWCDLYSWSQGARA